MTNLKKNKTRLPTCSTTHIKQSKHSKHTDTQKQILNKQNKINQPVIPSQYKTRNETRRKAEIRPTLVGLKAREYSRVLHFSRVGVILMGCSFHSSGATTEKVWSPQVFWLNFGMMSCVRGLDTTQYPEVGVGGYILSTELNPGSIEGICLFANMFPNEAWSHPANSIQPHLIKASRRQVCHCPTLWDNYCGY